MDTTQLDGVRQSFSLQCSGGTCDNTAACRLAGQCLYKSSAQEARELEEQRLALLEKAPSDKTVRTFSGGATRTADAGRDDPEGYLSPLVIDRFNEYMTKHRKQSDGCLRASDNWQHGMPLYTYIKGLWRHFLHLWTRHRGFPVRDPGAAADREEDLCAIIFNAQGYLHELLVERLGLRTKDSAR